MKVSCMCFGIFKGVEMRSSPFIKDDNIIGFIDNRSVIEVEHYIVNDQWFQLKGENAYIIMWYRTDNGLIDYACNRGQLKTFFRKNVDDDLIRKVKKLNIKEEEKEEVIEEVIEEVKKLQIKEEIKEDDEDDRKKKRVGGGRKKKERIPATVRNIVWVMHFEESKKGRCWLCKVEDISSANFECGHVVSEKNGGKPTIDNLKPICSFCNKSVGTMNMEDFKKKYNIP